MDSALLPATSGSTATRDHMYCLEIAKRSVARAALHLGIPSMTDEVLDVLGDVLCDYLQRFGATLAQGVESSGRSSQHVNALDALQAVELCTSPAVSRVHFTSSGSDANTTEVDRRASSSQSGEGEVGDHNNNNDSNNNINMAETGEVGGDDDKDRHALNAQHPPGSWQGLAAFCFGPRWQEHDAEKEELQAWEVQQGGGGKVGPSSTTNQQEESAKDVQEGWRAPFPDEVPLFPQCSNPSHVNNPHAMTPQQVLDALYTKEEQKTTQKAQDILTGGKGVSPEDAESERQGVEKSLGQIPENMWGGLSASGDKAKQQLQSATSNNPAVLDLTKSTTDNPAQDGSNKDTAAAASASNKRKLEEDEAAPDDAKEGEKADEAKEKKEESEAAAKDEKDEKSQPAKKKVKLDDGTAKTTKASTPSKKKADIEMKDADDGADKSEATAAAKDDYDNAAVPEVAHARHVTATGKHYNYVPTFFPPLPIMGTGQDSAHLRKTTVVDLLDHPPPSVVSSSGGGGATRSSSQDITAASAGGDGSSTAATTTFGLRSALVQLGTKYWGSDWEHHEDSNNKNPNAEVKVPVGRSDNSSTPTAGGTSSAGPIVPLGRASGSRVSRILEGSMDAATMQ